MNFDDYKTEIANALRETCPALASRVLGLSATASCSDVLTVESALRRADGLPPHVARCAARAVIPLTNAAANRRLATTDYGAARLDALRCALALTDNELAAMALVVRLREEEVERQRPVEAARQRAEYERRQREESERHEADRAAEQARTEAARAHDRRPPAAGVISTLLPVVSVPHRRDVCGYPDCAERCPDTIQERAPRSPEFAQWARAQVATLSSDVVGYVAGVEVVGLERGPRRPITTRLVASHGSEWLAWSACSVVDLIADGGTLVVLADRDLGEGERTAVELAASRGITVDVRRFPC